MKPKNPELAARIAAAGLTQGELAKRAGVNPGTISRLLCQHQRPHAGTARNLAAVLGTNPETLFPTEEGGRR